MNPNISIILPVYNKSEYIQETLESIINQTYSDFELIIIDDGSIDNSVEIINKTLKNTKINYKLYQQENKGVSSARNEGLTLSQGKYIVFVDGDDIIDKNHLKELNKSIKGKDFAFTQMIITDTNGKILTKKDAYEPLDDIETLTNYQLIKLELKMEIPFRFCQIMYKKSIIFENNIQFDETVSYGEDTEFALKTLLHGKTVGYTNKPTYFYIKNDSSSTHYSFLERFKFISILEGLAKYYHDYKMPKEDLADYPYLQEIIDLIDNYRIPRSIFGNLMFLFYKDYPFDEIMEEMENINYKERLRQFKPYSKKDLFFLFKTQIFLLNPKVYYKLWKTFKNSI